MTRNWCMTSWFRKNSAGTGQRFNLDDNQHLRVVFLPQVDVLDEAIGKFARFLDKYTK